MADEVHPRSGVATALAAAALFGLSAPAAKVLVNDTDPWLLAGLLYLGSGVSLAGLLTWRRRRSPTAVREAPIDRRDWPWLGAAILSGGVIGPVLLMFGLAWGSASASALLLNLEGVFTALLAWLVFREHIGARIALGVLAICLGAMVLARSPLDTARLTRSGLAVTGACLAWALDNNVTRKVSSRDPVQLAALKGLVAGAVNLVIAIARGAPFPAPAMVQGAAIVGALGYGVSLVLFIVALRQLGAARTGSYFSTAPFVGALGGVVALREPVTAALLIAAALMGFGVWLHVSERHEHEHHHEPMAHDHGHTHDVHHQHDHPAGTPAPHSHWHVHAPLLHRHPHYPDIHHRHSH